MLQRARPCTRWCKLLEIISCIVLNLCHSSFAATATDDAAQLQLLLQQTQPGLEFDITDPCFEDQQRLADQGVFVLCSDSAPQNISRLTLRGDVHYGSFSELSLPSLTHLTVRDTLLTGSLPEALNCQSLSLIKFENNTLLSSAIPAVWGGSGDGISLFPQLQSMELADSDWSGSLPGSWGHNGSFPELVALTIRGPKPSGTLGQFGLTGGIPEEWEGAGSFPSLEDLDLSYNSLTGSVPNCLLGIKPTDVSVDPPFASLTRVKVFQQWGSRLCAHVSSQNDLKLPPPILDLGAFNVDGDHLLKYLRAAGDSVSAGNSCSSSDGLHLLESLQSTLSENLSWVKAGTGVLEDTAVFLYSHEDAGNVNHMQVDAFIGLCDLPEVLLIMDALHLVPVNTSNCAPATMKYCEWPGITCFNSSSAQSQHVRSIDVSSSILQEQPETKRTLDELRELSYLPSMVRPGALPHLESLRISSELWGGIPVSWAASERLPNLQNFTLDGDTFIHDLPNDWFVEGTSLQSFDQLEIVTKARVGCLPVALADRALAVLHVLSSPSASSFPSLDLPGNFTSMCPVPPYTTGNQSTGVWTSSDNAEGSSGLRLTQSLRIPFTAAAVDISELSCATERDVCPVEEPTGSCELSWTELELPEGYTCGTAYFPAALGCDSCLSQSTMTSTCTDDCSTPPSGSLCRWEENPCVTELSSPSLSSVALFHAVYTIRAPRSAQTMPSGPYSLALSAAVAAGAGAAAAPVDWTRGRLVGRPGVIGVLVLDSPDSRSCRDVRHHGGLAMEIAEGAVGMLQDEEMREALQSALSAPMAWAWPVRCGDPGLLHTQAAVEVPPWSPASHYQLHMDYMIDCSEQDCPSAETAALSGRRMLQHAGPHSADDIHGSVLRGAMSTDAQLAAASDAMAQVLNELRPVSSGLDEQLGGDVDDGSRFLPEDLTVAQSDATPKSSTTWIALGVGAVVALLFILACSWCILRRRKRRRVPAAEYVKSDAEENSYIEPQIVPRTGPHAEPKIEYNGEAVEVVNSFARTAVKQDFVPGSGILQQRAPSQNASVSEVPLQDFMDDHQLLLSRLVLKGKAASQSAAERLASSADALFADDPFGIYRTAPFQTSMWEMLLSYREECCQPENQRLLPRCRFSCVGSLGFDTRFDELQELQRRRMAIVMLFWTRKSEVGKLWRAASSGIPWSSSSVRTGPALALIDEGQEGAASDAAAAGSNQSLESGNGATPGGADDAQIDTELAGQAMAPPSIGMNRPSANPSAFKVPNIFYEKSGPLTEDKLRQRQELVHSVLSMENSSLPPQASFPRPSSANANLTSTGSQGVQGGFASLSSPGAELPRSMDNGSAFNTMTSPNPSAPVRLTGLGGSLEAQVSQPDQSVSACSCISRSFSWPYCQSLATMDFQAPCRDDDGMIHTSARPQAQMPLFLSMDARHPMVFLGSVMFLGERQKTRLNGSVTAPFNPPNKLQGATMPLDSAALTGASMAMAAQGETVGNSQNLSGMHSGDISRLAKARAMEWKGSSGNAVLASNSRGVECDTMPLLPSARTSQQDEDPPSAAYVFVPPDNVAQEQRVDTGISDEKAAAQAQPWNILARKQPATATSQGAGTSGTRGRQTKDGYVQIADFVNGLSGIDTPGAPLHGMPPLSPSKQAAIIPPDAVSTSARDAPSENGMVTAFAILGECFQMIEKEPSKIAAIMDTKFAEIKSVVSAAHHENYENIDLMDFTNVEVEEVGVDTVPDAVDVRDQRNDKLGLGPLWGKGKKKEPPEQPRVQPEPHMSRVMPGLPDQSAWIDQSKLKCDSLLGRGAFGEVHYGTWEAPDGEIHEVAIKVLLATRYGSLRDHEQERGNFFKEMKLLMRMRHHSIVRCFGGAMAQSEGERDVIVLEYISGGTLDHYVHEHRRDSRLSLNEVLVIATDLADVLRYLHRHGIVHQDLKPSNILLNERGEVKLADFGISDVKRSTYLSNFMIGTAPYTAPEVFQAGQVNEKCDMFAIGILLWECLTGQRPFKNMHAFQIMMHLQNTSRQNGADWLPFPSATHEEFKRLIRRCWHADHRERISAEEALASAVLLRARIPEWQLNSPVPLDSDESKPLLPRNEVKGIILPAGQSSRSRALYSQSQNVSQRSAADAQNSSQLLPGGGGAAVERGRRDARFYENSESVNSRSNIYVPNSSPSTSPRKPPGTRPAGQRGDMPDASSSSMTDVRGQGASTLSWADQIPVQDQISTGFYRGFGDSTMSTVGPGATSVDMSRQGSSKAVSRAAVRSSSHKAAGQRMPTKQNDVLSVVAEPSEGDIHGSASIPLPDFALPGIAEASESGPPGARNSMSTRANSESSPGYQSIRSVLQPSQSLTPSQKRSEFRSEAQLLAGLPSMQEQGDDTPPPSADWADPPQPPRHNQPLGMQPCKAIAKRDGPGDGAAPQSWQQPDASTVSMSLATPTMLEDRPAHHGPSMNEVWKLASKGYQ